MFKLKRNKLSKQKKVASYKEKYFVDVLQTITFGHSLDEIICLRWSQGINAAFSNFNRSHEMVL